MKLLSDVRKIFLALSTVETWNVNLLKVKNSKKYGISYFCREVYLSPQEKIDEFISKFVKKYVGESKNGLIGYSEAREYDGSTNQDVLYYLKKDNELIEDGMTKLIDCIANPDTEENPLEIKYNAYLLKGEVELEGKKHPVKLISMQNPITVLQNKFRLKGDKFVEVSEKVLSLKNSLDVIICDDHVYMLTLAGEKLFDMERSYKAVCCDKIEEILSCEIVSDCENFAMIASTGHNPRKFVSYSENRLNKLQDKEARKRYAKQFEIPMKDDLFDTSEKDAADKVVKLLCKKGMIDPFENLPVEVSGAKRWI